MYELNTGLSLYLPTYSTKEGLALTEGFQTAPMSTSPTTSSVVLPFATYAGFTMAFVGDGAENASIAYKIWAVQSAPALDPTIPTGTACLNLFGSGTATYGTATPAGRFFSQHPTFMTNFPTSRFADTMTFTIEAWGQKMLDNYQLSVPAPYSPVDNTIAWLIVPFLGRVCRGLLIELANNDRTGERMNVLLSMCR